MILERLLNHIKSIGVILTIKDHNTIRVHIPEAVKREHPEVDQLITELKTHKQEAIKLLSQQKKAWIEPEVKPVRAILLWSALLHDYFWWLIDKTALPEIQKDGIPIYDSEEIDIMLGAKDDNERKQLHSFKKIFGATIRKNPNTKGGEEYEQGS